MLSIPPFVAWLAIALLATPRAFGAEWLVPEPPLELKGTQGKFDFIHVDAEQRRLLAAHTGHGTLDIVDLDHGTLLQSVRTGAAQDCAIDAKGGQYLVSVSKPPQLALVNAKTLALEGTIPLEGPADLLAFDPRSERAYVGHDDGKQLWLVSPVQRKVTGRIALPSEAPEGLAFDAAGGRLFQAMKIAATVCVIDVASGQVTANWPLAPATAPHGLATVEEFEALVTAGGNGQLVLLSTASGKVTASAALPERVDEIGYDAGLHRLYCASGLGKIAIYEVGRDHLAKLGEIASPEGARSLAVDAKTHAVWIAYAKGTSAFVQRFSAAP